jgi:hypothetical protein
VPTATANNTSFVGATSAANVVSNAQLIAAFAPITAASKGHVLGAATGNSATSAVANTDANILLYTSTSTNWAGIGSDTSGNMWFKVGTSGSPVPAMYLKASDQTVNFANTILPTANGTLNLGSATLRWGTVYTSDLDLNNGVGDWTIVEGEDDLFIYNNKKNKVYKFNLTEVDPADATPKK